MKKKIFSGVKPSGELTIGNYLGAIKNWIEMEKEYDSIFSIVDLHAITLYQDPKILKARIYKTIAWYLALGIDPKKSIIFIQSQVSAHTELAWILNCLSRMGELSRMTQFKDKSKKLGSDNISVGLFDYPVLMASDILLYDTDAVPVGEDQIQHVEFTRDLANKFNSKYGQIFKLPKPLLGENGARIMGLDNAEKKMDKSSDSQYNYILLEDSSELIRKKIAKAQTDSKSGIKFDKKRIGLFNLLTIYQLFSKLGPEKIEKKYEGKGYADFKYDLAEIIIENLTPFQEKYKKLIADKKYLLEIANDGTKKASIIAEKKLKKVKEKIGLI